MPYARHAENPTPKRGWFGVGLVGVSLVVLIGGTLVAGLLAAAATGLGYFSTHVPEPIDVPALQVDTRPALELHGTTDPAQFAELKAIQAALRGMGVGCGTGVVVASMRITPDGVVSEVTLDPAYTTGSAGSCVTARLEEAKIARTANTVVRVRAPIPAAPSP